MQLLTYSDLSNRLPGVSIQRLRATMNRLRLGSKIGRMRYFTEDDFAQLLQATRAPAPVAKAFTRRVRQATVDGVRTTDEVVQLIRQRQIERRNRPR